MMECFYAFASADCHNWLKWQCQDHTIVSPGPSVAVVFSLRFALVTKSSKSFLTPVLLHFCVHPSISSMLFRAKQRHWLCQMCTEWCNRWSEGWRCPGANHRFFLARLSSGTVWSWRSWRSWRWKYVKLREDQWVCVVLCHWKSSRVDIFLATAFHLPKELCKLQLNMLNGTAALWLCIPIASDQNIQIQCCCLSHLSASFSKISAFYRHQHQHHHSITIINHHHE